MKKEQIVTIILFCMVWGGTFIYSKGVTDTKIDNMSENFVINKDFASQQQRLDDLVVTVNNVVGRLDRLIEILMQQPTINKYETAKGK